jgi:hypothetical protein
LTSERLGRVEGIFIENLKELIKLSNFRYKICAAHVPCSAIPEE